MDADIGSNLQHGDVTERIIGAFYEVYNGLGNGFLEAVYESALALELEERGLVVRRQIPLAVHYKGRLVGQYVADLVVNDAVIVELKAVHRIDGAHEAQLINYLRATEIEVGLLLNFGAKPEFRRLVFANSRKRIRVDPR